jgi:CelD/BcsL family acetyltransferase involved in cellulose biosynthesis
VYNSGIDRRYMEYSPGWVLLGYLLKWANENGRETFDFMRGNEDYKYKFGALDRFVMRASLEF